MDIGSTSAPTIVIAGASGYIGQALIPALLRKFADAKIVALSRSSAASDDLRVEWKACDLFSLKSLEEALPNKIDLAIYLVHSMGPTAQMDQGSFADYDLILAGNFAKMLRRSSVQHLIYLGGLVPPTKELSLHLRSRVEVEETFAEYKLPTTVFRAGLIIGENGSSFKILTKLVERLPVMICPRWTQTRMSPASLESVVDSIVSVSLDPSRMNQEYDLADAKPITYVEMMRDTARAMGKKRYFLSISVFTPTLSRLWVSLITGASKGLVYPLVASLEHEMVARPGHLLSAAPAKRSYFDLLKTIDFNKKAARPKPKARPRRNTVRSVQRLPLPEGRDAEWLKNEYLDWLPKFLQPVIKVSINENRVAFSVAGIKPSMLDLEFNPERSNPDRQLLYIKGGLLSAKDNRGRLEFRTVLNRRCALAAIHDFQPSLPWQLYRRSQAILHVWVMRRFAGHLKRIHSRKTKLVESAQSFT